MARPTTICRPRNKELEMKAAILGTGSWGTAFGRHLAHKWDRVVLWGIEESQVDAINKTGEKKEVAYTITDEGKTLLTDTLVEKHKEHVEKAKYYELLMNKINV